MNSAEFLRILRIQRGPGASEVRLVADVRLGDLAVQAIVIVPFPSHEATVGACARIVRGLAPEMDPNATWVRKERMPDGEEVVVESGRLFRAQRKEDIQ